MNAPQASPAPSFSQSVWLVTEREIGSKLRSKAFIIGAMIQFAIALAAILIGGFTAASPSATPIAATADASSYVQDASGYEITEVASREDAEQLLHSEEVEAALVGDASSPVGFTVLFESDADQSLLISFAQVPPVEVLNPSDTNPLLRYLVAIGFGLVFFMAAMMFGSTIAQSVVEEKQTRVVELLISAIPARALLAGKVLGNTVLAMAQILILAAIAVVGLTVTGQTALLQGLGAPVVWFAAFFLFGFILLASLFAASAAMVSRQEDIGSTITPLTMLVIAPYMLVIIFNDNSLVLTIMSYVPFSAPVGMPMRLFLGEAQWWEPLLSLAILIASCALAIVIGAKIYRNSLLRMGARVKFAEALRAG